MTDYHALKETFEMAEVLEDFSDYHLELKTTNVDDTEVVTITFLFNEDLELTRVYTE